MKVIDAQKVFGHTVKVSRNLLGISQETLAEKSELHRTYISDVERGERNPSMKTIIRLAHALEVSISTLFPPEMEHWKIHGSSDKDAGRNFADILLVEDEADDVELALLAFKKARFLNRIQVVSDGAEALDYLFFRGKYVQRKPAEGMQVILLDLSRPKLSGLEVLRIIKTDERTSMMPVVVLTNSSNNEDIAECRRLGAGTYITKPLDWIGFGTAVKKLNLDWALIQPPVTFGQLRKSILSGVQSH